MTVDKLSLFIFTCIYKRILYIFTCVQTVTVESGNVGGIAVGLKTLTFTTYLLIQLFLFNLLIILKVVVTDHKCVVSSVYKILM